MKTILFTGLSGSGKSTLSTSLNEKLNVLNKKSIILNADKIRAEYDDWDFSMGGRIRQANRMKYLSEINNNLDFVILDFISPTNEIRNIISPDYLIWVNTIEESKFKNTDSIFEIPFYHDILVNSKNSDFWSNIIINYINN